MEWVGVNYLLLNVDKTNEMMVIDFRKKVTTLLPLRILGSYLVVVVVVQHKHFPAWDQ